MALKALRIAARQVMVHAGASEAAVARFEAKFESAALNPGAPLPCPRCFMAGRIGRLNPLQAPQGTAAVRCNNCGEGIWFRDTQD